MKTSERLEINTLFLKINLKYNNRKLILLVCAIDLIIF